MHTKTHLEPVNDVYKERIRGLFFVSTFDGRKANFHLGCWSTQCSHEPPRMLTCFPKEIEGYDIVCRSGVWALSLMSEDQAPLAHKFFKEGTQDIRSIGSDEFIFKDTGCAILKNGVGYFDCKMVSFIDNGDFGLAIGDVLSTAMLQANKRNLTVNQLLDEGIMTEREKNILPFHGFEV